MHAPRVSIIIPVFNKWELTRNCLAALREHTPGDIEVIVVDNASADETASGLEPFGRGFRRNLTPPADGCSRKTEAPLFSANQNHP